ncbi:unnamed protein product, partial [Polarella glacialis]
SYRSVHLRPRGGDSDDEEEEQPGDSSDAGRVVLLERSVVHLSPNSRDVVPAAKKMMTTAKWRGAVPQEKVPFSPPPLAARAALQRPPLPREESATSPSSSSRPARPTRPRPQPSSSAGLRPTRGYAQEEEEDLAPRLSEEDLEDPLLAAVSDLSLPDESYDPFAPVPSEEDWVPKPPDWMLEASEEILAAVDAEDPHTAAAALA